MGKKWLTPQESAAYMNTTLPRIYELVKSDDVRSYVKPWSKSRPYRLISTDDLDAYVMSWEQGKDAYKRLGEGE
ncbi:MAG: hypothetical protein RR842_09815 [Gordonibacter sp.]|uniref:hypothetical protein n=1 Tax=Gordonibacter sp. TaxID=1968902 RepID=UPI002FC89358